MQQVNQFDSLKLLKKINSEGTILLTMDDKSKLHYVLKIFPYTISGKLNQKFRNEIEPMKLKHPNLMPATAFQYETKLKTKKFPKSSCCLIPFCPYGDLEYFMTRNKPLLEDEKLIRTFFHHLIEGLEYLHENEFFHLDLKVQNLVIGEDFLLKITDFDLSCREGYEVIGLGTEGYSPPEMKTEQNFDMRAADLFSTGIILFTLKSGYIPEDSDEKKNTSLLNLLWDRPEKFWLEVCERDKKSPESYSEEFKVVFETLTKKDPKQRPTITELKKMKWYNKETYTQTELQAILQPKMKSLV